MNPIEPPSTEPVEQPLAKPQRKLLPRSLRSAWFLALVWVVPQALLLLLNLRAFALVGGEMNADQHQLKTMLLAAEITLLAIGVLVCLVCHFRRWSIHWLISLPILLLHVSLLAFIFFYLTGDMLPDSTSLWILPPQRMLFQQFALLMPAVFYGVGRLACFPLTIKGGADAGLSFAACIILPACWYFGLIGLGAFNRHVPLQGWIVGFYLILLTVLSLAAMVRFTVLTYRGIRSKGDHGMMLFSLFIALVGPIAGLSLNHLISFPFDFQAWPVYAIAAVNGVLMTIPPLRHAWGHRLQWIGVCLLFSYVIYFFLVFLPFLPLALLAMIVMLSGLLMLVPSVLLVLQSLRIRDGYRRECRALGRPLATTIMLVAIIALPAFYTLRASMHRSTLHKAIDYVYDRDPANLQPFTGRLGMLGNTLRSLHRSENGFELPFLTAYYNQIVFDGMTLPSEKLQHIHQTFFGEQLETKPFAPILGDLFSPNARDPWQNVRLNAPPSTIVDLQSCNWNVVADGDCTKAVASIQVGFTGDGIREFSTQFNLPPGVFISGFWLTVGKDRVPGRIFEKKAALWVYKMIRDTSPRDPGLLVYTDPETINLRVYPVVGNEPRNLEIEFLIPPGIDPQLAIERWVMPQQPPSDEAHWITSERGSAVILPQTAPRTTRSPYLHAIIDRSAEARPLADQFQAIRKHAADRAIEEVLLTAVNFEMRSSGDTLIPIENLEEAIVPKLPQRGGFLFERGVQHALLQHQRLADESIEWASRKPVVFADAKESWRLDRALEWFLPLDPVGDAEGVVLVESAGRVRAVGQGEAMTFIAAGAEPRWLRAGRWEPIPGRAFSHATYAQGVDAWLRHEQRSWRGETSEDGLKEMVKLSRDSGILLPDTSYIVVENSAQWNMLERKEKEALAGNEHFEFDAPAPGIMWLLGPVLVLLAGRRRVRSKAY